MPDVKAVAKIKDAASSIKEKAKDTRPEKKPDAYEIAIAEYNEAYTKLSDQGVMLFLTRQSALDMISLVEDLVNSVANTPKSFEADLGEIHAERCRFIDATELAKKELANAVKTAKKSGAGFAAAAAVANLAPTAAMWVATTFGTASTGTAIATLSGAAAESAALAWLGGGALAAGGGGVAAGQAFLALAGPIGWSIAGATLLASIVLFSRNKLAAIKDKNEQILSVKLNTEAVKNTTDEIEYLRVKTESLLQGIRAVYAQCIPLWGADYSRLNEGNQLRLASMVNEAKTLMALVGRTIGASPEEETTHE